MNPEPEEDVPMITIEMPVWTLWLLGAILVVNVVTVAIDVVVRLKTYKLLLAIKSA